MMNGAKYVHLLLAAVVLSALCDTSCEEAVDTTWLQLHVSNDSQPKLLKEQQKDCLTDDMACVARKTACNLAKTMKEEWPLKYSNISRIVDQLNDGQGNRSPRYHCLRLCWCRYQRLLSEGWRVAGEPLHLCNQRLG